MSDDRLENMCYKVTKSFEQLRENEIGIEYHPLKRSYASLAISKESNTFRMIVGNLFFELPEEEREAAIAHELGHYIRLRGRGDRNKGLMKKLNIEFMNYSLSGIAKSDLRAERLMRRVKLSEYDADKKAVEAGYGPQLLSLLKNLVIKHGSNKSMDSLMQRIKTLEDKLKQGGE
ncbi:hypothetical protein FJZ53_01375 [Candidatus Woesearchaeota archaeon]|nr:hypothetical protein [Candidatus Woesearchaeota archaeon]